MTPTVNIALDKSYRIKKGPNAGKYHAKVWVTFIRWVNNKKDWDQCPYLTGLFVTEAEFKSLMDSDPKTRTRIEALKAIRKKLDDKKRLAEDIIEKYMITDQVTFDRFFLSDHRPETLAGQYELKINELRAAKPKPKISSAEKYVTSLHSLQEFFGEHVSFQDCTADRLLEYEEWYIGQPKSKKDPDGEKQSLTSVGINIRCLRHIFKRAFRWNIIPPTLYPFGLNEDQYTIPEGGDDTKQFLETHEKDLFLSHRFKAYKCTSETCGLFTRSKKFGNTCPHCRKAYLVTIEDDLFNELHDYAVFSYFANGINAADIFRLRKSIVYPEYIGIKREKSSSRKKKKGKIHTIPIHPRMREIMRRRGNVTIGKSDYFLFPVLNDEMTEEEKFSRVRRVVKQINEMLAAMATDLKWVVKPTFYTLRHTFSNEMIQMGATTEELQDALAHELKQTTEHYKHGFSMEKKKKFSQGL